MYERQGPCPEIGEKEKFVKIEIICLRSESMGRKKKKDSDICYYTIF